MQAYSRSFWRAVETLRRPVITFWVINRDYDPVRQLMEFRRTVPEQAEHLLHVVKNQFYSADGRFPTYDGSDTRRAVESAGGRTVSLPVLAERNRERLYDRRQTIEEILTEAAFGDRVEMQLWVEDVEAQFGPVLYD